MGGDALATLNPVSRRFTLNELVNHLEIRSDRAMDKSDILIDTVHASAALDPTLTLATNLLSNMDLLMVTSKLGRRLAERFTKVE